MGGILNNNKKLIFNIFVILSGLLFIFSGISKLLPIYAFEFLFVRENILGWGLAPFAARLIITAELFLGIQLCLLKDVKRIYIPAAILMLVVFSVYLGYSIIAKGVGANCGCFGELLPMSTTSALIKNVGLIFVLALAFININETKKINFRIPSLVVVMILGFIFILFPVKAYEVPVETAAPIIKPDTLTAPAKSITKKEETPVIKETSKKIEVAEETKKEKQISFLEKYPSVNSVYSKFTSFSGKEINPDEGEKIVAVFSLDCEHCMAVSKELSAIKKKFQLPQVLVLFLGSEDQVAEFYGDGFHFPYSVIEPIRFFPLLKKAPPRISYLVNGNIIGNWVEEDFSEANLINKIKETRGK